MAPRGKAIVGVDLGGTSVRAIVVPAALPRPAVGPDRILGRVKTPTQFSRKPKAVIQEIADAVEEATAAAGLSLRDLAAVSVGAPGSVERDRGVVVEAPNLGWRNVPLGGMLEEILLVPVFVDNDVNVGVVGEHALGAGQGAQEMVGVFVGTGIGGGIISRGQLYVGSRGAAGEIGHMVLQVDGPRCPCGRRGCAEALASRTAMERDVRAAIRAGRRSVVPHLMKKHHKDRMTSSIIARALKRRDPVVREVFSRAQGYLGELVANVVNLFDPEVVVIGGGIADRFGEDFVGPIRERAQEGFLCQRKRGRVRIVPGSLGDDAGALGAVVLARRRLSHRQQL